MDTNDQNPLYANTVMLAFLGDAVYESRVRFHIIQTGMIHGDRLHRAATRYVRASAQATAMRALFGALSDAEQALVKRARNKKSDTRPRNADPVAYKWATAFEALLGYYCLSGQTEKLDATTAAAIQIIDEGGGGDTAAAIQIIGENGGGADGGERA
jgi:ribonuclease-3 family protein